MDISVIIPIYNVEIYIEKCLESILNQSGNFSYELILVNDQTKDNSIIIAENYLNKNAGNLPWKIIHNKKNGGLSFARNEGIKGAIGDYVYFLDSDDYVEHDILNKLFQPIINDRNIEIVVGNGIWHKKDGASQPIRDPHLFSGKITSADLLDGLYNGKFPAYIWLNLFKKNIFDTVAFPVNVVWEDLLTWPYILDRDRKIFAINDLLYHYVSRDGSISERFDPRMLPVGEHLFMIGKRFGMFENKASVHANSFAFFYAKTFLELSWKVVFLSEDKKQSLVVLKEWAKYIPFVVLKLLFKNKFYKKFCLMTLWKFNPSCIYLLWNKK